MSGVFARMLRCARSTAGSARPPPSRKPPCGTEGERHSACGQIRSLKRVSSGFCNGSGLPSDFGFVAFPGEFDPPSTWRRTKSGAGRWRGGVPAPDQMGMRPGGSRKAEAGISSQSAANSTRRPVRGAGSGERARCGAIRDAFGAASCDPPEHPATRAASTLPARDPDGRWSRWP